MPDKPGSALTAPPRARTSPTTPPATTYIWSAGKQLFQHYRRAFITPRTGVEEATSSPVKLGQACATASHVRSSRTAAQRTLQACSVLRSIHAGARDLAREIAKTDAYQTSRRQRTMVEMLFAHLQTHPQTGPSPITRPVGSRDEFHLAATRNRTSVNWPN